MIFETVTNLVAGDLPVVREASAALDDRNITVAKARHAAWKEQFIQQKIAEMNEASGLTDKQIAKYIEK